ncbi:VWA domain-containing protein [Alicyclobacillus herbarius]|uniref:VWA domain-containing protein n=1 Tax=Alicyclobacillus herbarius TaxID=122960 RepID=UPI00041ECF9F|nr:VWA domain-containing protein [Alicyclobacillus herbarius]
MTEENLIAFLRALRSFGFQVGAEEETLVMRALAAVGWERPEVCAAAVRAVVAKGADQFWVFDTLWRQFLFTLRRPESSWVARNTLAANVARLRAQRWTQPQVIWRGRSAQEKRDAVVDEGQAQTDIEVAWRSGASREERLRQTDFARLTAAELRELAHLAQGFAAPVRRSRRWRASRQRQAVDLARTVRRSLAAGEVLRFAYQSRADVARPVLLLCDVSGSMEPYSRALLTFAHVLLLRRARVEVFVFSTRLSRITRELRQQSADRAITDALRRIPDFAGGTRLTDALAEFRSRYARRMLQAGAYILLATDGFEAGGGECAAQLMPGITSPSLPSRGGAPSSGGTQGHDGASSIVTSLEAELTWLARWTPWFIWLNPLASDPRYRAVTLAAGVLARVADEVLPAGNWADLESAWRSLLEHSSRPGQPKAAERRRRHV